MMTNAQAALIAAAIVFTDGEADPPAVLALANHFKETLDATDREAMEATPVHDPDCCHGCTE